MEATDILAENVMESGFANMENENRCVVTVEEHPCVNMVASMPNVNPVADHHTASMTYFVALVSSARQMLPVSIAVWCMWVESFPDGNPIVFGAIVSSTQTKRFRDDFA
jgi:glycine/D-amino acid oxidase-like deaminating enzyme